MQQQPFVAQADKILVLRALQLGDMLCAVPAFRALRAYRPSAHITLLGLPWSREFARRFSRYFDDFLEFPGFTGLPERPLDVAAFPLFLQTAQRRGFDLVLQLHGSGVIVNSLLPLLGARRCAGYYQPPGPCPDPELFMLYPDREHEIWRHLRLMRHLGVPLQGDHLEFEVLPTDLQSLSALHRWQGLRPGSYAVLHPGARAESRRWPAESFAALGDRLAAQGLQVVLTGAFDEEPLVARVGEAMKAPAVNLCGLTDLGMLAALLSSARLLVCNDTGISHLAAALRTPSVVVFTRSDALGWPPLDRVRHRVVSRIWEVTVSDVLTETTQLLREPPVRLEAIPPARPSLAPKERSHAA